MRPCIFVFAVALPMIGRAINRPGAFGSAGAPISGVPHMGASGISQVPRQSIPRLCSGPRPRTTLPTSPVTVGQVLPPGPTHRRRHYADDFGANPAALSAAVYASRPPLPGAMQDSLPAGCRAGVEPTGLLRTVSGLISPPFVSLPPFRGLLDASWAHAHREFFELADVEGNIRKGKDANEISPIAFETVKRIDALFDIEREINGLDPAARLAARKAQSASLVSALEHGLRDQRALLSKHAKVAKAIDYLLSPDHWPGFTRFLDDGQIRLTNNSAKRSLRGVALGRKSWLFAGSERSGHRAAFMYSMIGINMQNERRRTLRLPARFVHETGQRSPRQQHRRLDAVGLQPVPQPLRMSSSGTPRRAHRTARR